METYKFSITGITCSSCVKQIETTFKDSNEFDSVQVFRQPDRVEVRSNKHIYLSDINALFDKFALNKYKAFDFDLDEDGPISNPTSKSSNELKSRTSPKSSLFQQLFPLTLVISYLLGTVLAIAYLSHDFSVSRLMSHYMGGFFLIFSFFKFLNINGFADAFQTYDPIARRWRGYGYIYASLELVAGISYLAVPHSVMLNSLVLIILSISSWGVTKAVLSKKSIQCACLGTVFNLPMTKVTIVENVFMILMALYMII